MKRIRCLLIESFIFLLLAVILISCGGGGSSNFDSSNCNVPVLELTLEQAIANIEQMNLYRKVEFDAVVAMEQLTAIGVSVSSAYQLIIASIEHDIIFQPIVEVLLAVIPTTGPAVTDIATTAIKYNYSSEDVDALIRAVQTGTNAGAGSDIPAEIVCAGIQRKLDANTISSIMDGYVADINNGLSPTAARDNAINKINALS